AERVHQAEPGRNGGGSVRERYEIIVTNAGSRDSQAKHHWQVRIEHATRGLVGIPIRDVTKEEAVAASKVISYAFEYGLAEGRRTMMDIYHDVAEPLVR